MGIYKKCGKEINKIFVGADIHQKTWYITIISQERALGGSGAPGFGCSRFVSATMLANFSLTYESIKIQEFKREDS